ncbi:MAG: RNA chaperone Hfq [Holophagales bacterium]|nr:RNA chaperone Hfq [Holophagales bacterium]MBK9965564.1 RNA chaperone Hfq [Holophagales bacterium]
MASVRKPPTPGPSTGGPGPESELGPRKLIRPSLSEVRRDGASPRGVRKGAPPDQTNAESFYYLKQMQARTAIVVRLVDGEELRGWIEWYDKDALKLNRENAPNLLLQKHAIKYLYKEEEERQFRRRKVRTERGPGDGGEGGSAPPGAQGR